MLAITRAENGSLFPEQEAVNVRICPNQKLWSERVLGAREEAVCKRTRTSTTRKRRPARLTSAGGRRIKCSARGPVIWAGVGSAPPGNPERRGLRLAA